MRGIDVFAFELQNVFFAIVSQCFGNSRAFPAAAGVAPASILPRPSRDDRQVARCFSSSCYQIM